MRVLEIQKSMRALEQQGKLVLRMRLVKLLFLGKNSRLKLELVLLPYEAKHVVY